MAAKDNPTSKEVGALWANDGPRGPWLSGVVNGQRVVCFPCGLKSAKAPTWKVYESLPRDMREKDDA